MSIPSIQMLPRGAERSVPTWAASAVSLTADMEFYIKVHLRVRESISLTFFKNEDKLAGGQFSFLHASETAL